MSRARPLGVNHVAFAVHDLEETLAWYERFFAVTLRGRRERMAWIDLGDQFLALTESDREQTDSDRHVGLVVDDREALRAALLRAGEDVAESGSLRVRDPSGNQLEIVDYRDVQFTKTDAVLAAMGASDLHKSDAALKELRTKGIDDAS